MKMQADKLARRREELIARCAAQRKSLRLQNDQWRQSLSVNDMAYTVLERIKRYQLWILGAGIALVIIKPRRVAALMHATTTALATWRSIAPVVQTVQRRVWLARNPGHMQM